MNKVSVVIPAYNEEETIEAVIDFVRNENNIEPEIIVVDNCSSDKTRQIANSKNVKVLSCNIKGKGAAMLQGLKNASSDIVIFLDADIINYENNIIDKLVSPILNENIDFVKSTFNRKEGGTVTEIMVKPMLDLLFPNMYKFSEPVSGIIACKKEFLNKIQLEEDYGVDIGILLDAINFNAKIKEVNIGNITNGSHKGKTVKNMSDMSRQIMRVILKKYNDFLNK